MKWKPIQKKCNLILVRKKKTEFFFCFFFLFLILKGSAVVGAALFPLFTVSLGRSRLRDLPSILRANGSARERETKQHAHLKPTTPPITPLTDDVQKWDDPKERRSVKRMIIYFIFFFSQVSSFNGCANGGGKRIMRSPTSYSRKKATPIVSCGIGRVTLTMGGIVLRNPSQISSYQPTHPPPCLYPPRRAQNSLRCYQEKRLKLFFFESIRVVSLSIN